MKNIIHYVSDNTYNDDWSLGAYVYVGSHAIGAIITLGRWSWHIIICYRGSN